MIASFKCPHTKALAEGQRTKRFQGIERTALRKIRQLQIAEYLDDLKVPPGNRLQALKGNRAEQYSIRINEQFRICFRWTSAGAVDVEIVDYH
jgi:proteic killer suppression protein